MASRPDPTDRRFEDFCATGDPEALGEVFDRTAAPLLRIATWLAGNRADAEDLLQRTFLAAILTRGRFRAGAPVLPWLMGLLGNQARRLRRERDRAAAARTPRDRVDDPAAAIAANELAATVRSIGDRLGAPYADVLRLHLEQGLDCNEIAARLRRPAGTVRTQLVRALEQLRQRLPAGFGAGVLAVAAVSTGSLGALRAAVLDAARDAAPAATATSSEQAIAARASGIPLAHAGWLALPALAVVAVIALAAQRSAPTPALAAPSTAVAAAASGRAQREAEATPGPERTPVEDPLQDPVPVDLPRLFRLGAMPEGSPAAVLDAEGRRTKETAVVPEGALVHIDAAAPWRAVTALLADLRRAGAASVQFAARLPDGRHGCFALALPAAADAGAALRLRMHRDRPGVPPDSFVPVLQRMLRGREDHVAGMVEGLEAEEKGRLLARFPLPFALAVEAPDDAPFGSVLQVLAAAHRAGVQCVLPTTSGPGAGGNPRAAHAIDLGPAPRIAVAPRALPAPAPVVTEGLLGCTVAATLPSPQRQPMGAGAKYGGRGGRRTTNAAVDGGLAWLAAAQHADGSLPAEDGRGDVEATALAMLALLAEGEQLWAGEHEANLAAGIGWLLDQQRDDGAFAPPGPQSLRVHALATWAMAEAYGLSFAPELRGSLLDALAWAGAQRLADGGFDDDVPAVAPDRLATISMAMALATAEFFRVEVPVASADVMGLVAAMPGEPTSAESAAAAFGGLFTRQVRAVDTALAERLAQRTDAADPWCAHWTSHFLYQAGSRSWRAWTDQLQQMALQRIDDGSALAGSWAPAGGCSRATTTALRVLALQTYYRYTKLVR